MLYFAWRSEMPLALFALSASAGWDVEDLGGTGYGWVVDLNERGDAAVQWIAPVDWGSGAVDWPIPEVWYTEAGFAFRQDVRELCAPYSWFGWTEIQDLNDSGQAAGSECGAAGVWNWPSLSGAVYPYAAAPYRPDPFGWGDNYNSYVRFVNDAGAVAGERWRWVPGGGSVPDLFATTNLGGAVAYASGILVDQNEAGTVLLGLQNGGVGVWDPAAGVTVLQVGAFPTAQFLNDAGQVVGQSSFGRVFFWDPGRGALDLGPGTAIALNEAGQVLLSSNNGIDPRVVDPLAGEDRHLGGLGGGWAIPSGLADDGSVIGWAPDAQGGAVPFWWRADLGMLDLGTDGGDGCVPLTHNASGTVAGQCGTSIESLRYVAWDVFAGELTVLAQRPFRDQGGPFVNARGDLAGGYLTDPLAWPQERASRAFVALATATHTDGTLLTPVRSAIACIDVDNDLVCDATDTCLGLPNPGFEQRDMDADGLGDVCDPDADGDGALDLVDVCLWLWDPEQADLDGDGEGDACDDTDGDGALDDVDVCPGIPDFQWDLDADGRGDACDLDDDGDGTPDTADACAADAAPPPDLMRDGCSDDSCDLRPWIQAQPNIAPLVRGVLLRDADAACAAELSGDDAALGTALEGLRRHAATASGHGLAPSQAAVLVAFAVTRSP